MASQGSGGTLTGVITASTGESLGMARRLTREEGIFCGISSGCNMVAAVKLATRHPEIWPIVVLACDTGQRYFSAPLCGEAKRVEVPEREHPLDPRSRALLDRFQAGWEIIE